MKDFSDIHYVNEEVTVDRNSDFYGWHSDVYELICNDLYNDEARKRVFESTTITGYNGRIYPGKIKIPEQGESNDYEKTEYWSLSEDIVADYWSDEFVNIYSDVEINAIYKKPVNVIYDANGGTFDNDYPEIPETKYIFYNISGNKRLPFFTADSEPYRSGYLFQYIWNTNADGTGQEYPYDESFTCENDLRLFAVWKPAGSPQMSVIDRYFFVGEKITYDDIIEKIIAKDEFGFPALEKVKVISINDRRTDGLSNDEIADKIVADSPRQYNLAVRLITNGVMINKNYTIYIIDKANDINRLRYISDDFLDTFHIDSKWNYAYNFGKLVISLNKSREDSEFTYVITKEGVE